MGNTINGNNTTIPSNPSSRPEPATEPTPGPQCLPPSEPNISLPQDEYSPSIRNAPRADYQSPGQAAPVDAEELSTAVTVGGGVNTALNLAATSSVKRNQALADATKPQVEPKRMPKKMKGKGKGKAKMRKQWHAQKKTIRTAAPNRAAAYAGHTQAVKGAKVLQTSTKVVGKGLAALSVGINVADVVANGPTETTAGTVTNAVLTGALTYGVSVVPPLAIADAVTGGQVSDHYKGTASVLTVTAEGLITGDPKGMESFHKKSKNGEYGVVMKSASEAGDFWAEKGIIGGLEEFGSEFVSLFK